MSADSLTPRQRLPTRVLRRVRLGVLRRRRLLAAAFAGLAVALGVHAASADPPPTALVWVAAHDLPAGTHLAPGDLEQREFVPSSVPQGAVSEPPAGARLAAPLREGEAVTDVRLWDDALLATYADRVSVPVRLPDAEAVALLEAGDAVDLWASDPRAGEAELVVAGAPVVSVPPVDRSVDATAGRLVVLAVPSSSVGEVTSAQARQFLSFALAPIG